MTNENGSVPLGRLEYWKDCVTTACATDPWCTGCVAGRSTCDISLGYLNDKPACFLPVTVALSKCSDMRPDCYFDLAKAACIGEEGDPNLCSLAQAGNAGLSDICLTELDDMCDPSRQEAYPLRLASPASGQVGHPVTAQL